MEGLHSSDGTLYHRFKHNKLGHLQYTSDEITGSVVSLQIDSFGNVINEILPSGVEVASQYDPFDRITQFTMGKYGQVAYTYNPLQLLSVKRCSQNGVDLYSHTYDSYDLDGNLVEENMLGNLGSIKHSYDLLQRENHRTSPFFSQICVYDSIGNSITNSRWYHQSLRL